MYIHRSFLKFSFASFLVFAFVFAAHQAQAFTVSTNSISVIQNQTAYVSLSSSAGASVSNGNPNLATVSLSGNQLTITGLTVGSGVVTVCITGDGCQSISVSVTSSATTTTNTNTPPTFSSGNTLNLLSGASDTVTITGNGGYIVTSNANPTIAGASIGGDSLYVMGNGQGGDNITVCDGNNQCSTLYVSVSGTSVASTIVPNLISFTVGSTNHNNSFLGAGSSLSLNFSTNQPMTTVSVDVNGQSYIPSGTGTGPFTVNYLMQGTEPTPLPILINYAEADGTQGSFSFELGNPSSSAVTTSAVTTATGDIGCTGSNAYSITTGAPCSTSTTTTTTTPASNSSSIMSYQFNDPLYEGMTSTEVLALQERLTAEGVYSGPQTGYYGPLTVAAVQAYQAKVGLTQLGNVGPGTRAALNSGK